MSDSQKNISEEQEEQIQSDSSEIDEQNPIANRPQSQEKVIIQKEENDDRCATYVFQDEDHTLGNMLRVILSGNSDVQFVGYSIPHPSDNKMNVRLQTYAKNSNQILDDGFKTIHAISKTIRQKFEEAVHQYNSKAG